MQISIRITATNEAEARHLEAEYELLKSLGYACEFAGRNATNPGEWDYFIIFHSVPTVAQACICLASLKELENVNV